MNFAQDRKDQIQELIRCGKDPIHFICNYAKIEHPDRGLIPFQLFEFQKDIITGYLKHKYNVVLKARQLGVTTVTAAYIAWYILFYKHKNVLVVATKQDVAKTTIRTIRNIYKHLPKWLFMSEVSTNNKLEVELSNGSRAKAVTTSSDVGRSEAVSFLVIDEAAHIDKMEEIWTGLWPTISNGGRVALLSTPKGTGNFFHKTFEQAKNGENNFNCRFGSYTNPYNPNELHNDRFPWWLQPHHDMAWFEHFTKGKSARDIAQEMLCNFNMSGDTLLFGDDLKYLESRTKQPLEKTNFDRNLWIWEYPSKGGTYVIACDVSRGDARDFSAFHVLRLDSPIIEQVAEYRGKVTPDVLGLILMEASTKYNNAIIAIENNNGWAGQAIMAMQQKNYPFIYHTSKKRRGFIDPYYQSADDTPGYTVTSSNRMDMIAKMEEAIRKKQINLYSERLLSEFKTFIWNNNRPEAMRSYNDDLVMSLAGAILVKDEIYIANYRSADATKMLLDNMSVNSRNVRDCNQFDFSVPTAHSKHQIKEFMADQNQIRMGNGDVIDLSWLLPTKG